MSTPKFLYEVFDLVSAGQMSIDEAVELCLINKEFAKGLAAYEPTGPADVSWKIARAFSAKEKLPTFEFTSAMYGTDAEYTKGRDEPQGYMGD